MDRLVLVTGLPGSGKTSVAIPLARTLDLTLLSEDAMKEGLFDLLQVANRRASTEVGEAVRTLFLSSLGECRNAVVDAFWRHQDVRHLADLEKYYVQVHCSCGPFEAMNRYRHRAVSTRHWGHHDEEIVYDSSEVWSAEADSPLNLSGTVIAVDTRRRVDIDALSAAVSEVLVQGGS